MERLRSLSILLLQAAFLLLAAAHVHAQDMPVPAELQANIFKKIFEYSKNHSNTAEVIVLVTSESPTSSAAQDVVKAFGAAGIKSKAVSSQDLTKALSLKSVVYVLGDVSAIKGICEKNSILCISGFPKLAESGQVAVGLGLEAGKPKIMIHKSSLEAEKQEFSSKLLQLAKIID